MALWFVSQGSESGDNGFIYDEDEDIDGCYDGVDDELDDELNDDDLYDDVDDSQPALHPTNQDAWYPYTSKAHFLLSILYGSKTHRIVSSINILIPDCYFNTVILMSLCMYIYVLQGSQKIQIYIQFLFPNFQWKKKTIDNVKIVDVLSVM